MKKLTLEERFRELCEGLKHKIYDRIYIVDKNQYYYKQIFYNDKEILMDYGSKTGRLWVKYSPIWKVFETEYDMSYEQIQGLIKTQMEEAFKRKGLTPYQITLFFMK